jgi:hypothetical protein
VWIYFSGIGSFGSCLWDYIKHNLVFSNLLEHKLPIIESPNGKAFIWHYSWAYYITPVRFYQLLKGFAPSVSLDAILLILYSVVLFASVSVLARSGTSRLVLFAVFMTGGLDLIGMPIFGVNPVGTVETSGLVLPIPFNVDWWGLPFAPQSLTMNLYYAPQHFFGALIGTALLYASVQSGRPAAMTLVEMVIIISASAFWSPYVAVGLEALALILVLTLDRNGTTLERLRNERLRPLFTPRGLVALAFAAVLAAAALLFLWAAKPLSAPALILDGDNTVSWLLTYAINYAPFILAVGLAAWPRAWKDGSSAGVEKRKNAFRMLACGLLASALVLTVAHGFYNDWAMRATLPLSIALSVALAKVLLGGMKWPYLVTMLVVLLVSSASSVTTLMRSILLPSKCAPYGAFDLEDMGDLASQYRGRQNSVLYRYLVRPQ